MAAVGNVLRMERLPHGASCGLGFDLLCRFRRRLRNPGLAIAQTQRAPPAVLALWVRDSRRGYIIGPSAACILSVCNLGWAFYFRDTCEQSKIGSVTSDVTTFGYVNARVLLSVRFVVGTACASISLLRIIEFGHWIDGPLGDTWGYRGYRRGPTGPWITKGGAL
jgi:hypothetical protein